MRIRSILASILLPLGASAVDGVIEINQASVDAAGGTPFTINQSGSYRLTSDIEHDGSGSHVFRIDGPVGGSVGLDLNGFEIRGGSGSGIAANFLNSPTVTIRNGTIRGSSGPNVAALLNARIEDLLSTESGNIGVQILSGTILRVRSVGNASHGFGVSGGSSILQSSATGNTLNGVNVLSSIDGGRNILIADSVISGNLAIGLLLTGAGAVVRDSVVAENGGVGINASRDLVLTGSVVRANTGTGVLCGTDCVIQQNVISSNGGDGINVDASTVGTSGRAVILGNSFGENADFGIRCSWLSCGYGHNVFRENGGTLNNATPTELGTNFCDSNTTCP